MPKTDDKLSRDNAARENKQQAKRLSKEWLKVEKALDAAGVLQTIVFFGSARTQSRQSALRQQNKAKQLALNSANTALALKAKQQAELILQQSRYYEEARLLAKQVGQHLCQCNDTQTKLITGGGPGIMEAANRGAADIGSQSIGLNVTIAREQKPNPFIGKGLSFKFRYFSLRKMHFLKRAKAVVVFPGGFGTLDELMEVLTLIQTGKIQKIPIILYGKEYWSNAINFNFLAEQGLIDSNDLTLYTVVDDVKTALHLLIKSIKCSQ